MSPASSPESPLVDGGATHVDLGEVTPDLHEKAPVPSAAPHAGLVRRTSPSSFARTFSGFTGLQVPEGRLAQVREQLRAEAATARASRNAGMAQRKPSPRPSAALHATAASSASSPTASPSAPAQASSSASARPAPRSPDRHQPSEPARSQPSVDLWTAVTAPQLQPSSTCSEPFPEPPAHLRAVPSGATSLAHTLMFARSIESPASALLATSALSVPLDPMLGSVTASSFPGSHAESSGVGGGITQSREALVGSARDSAFAAARSDLSRFKSQGSRELKALEEDLQGLIERQDEAERLADQVTALVLAETYRPHHLYGVTAAVA